jgi:uncharacterized protein YjbI with pentapeptide repeats
VSDFGPEPDRAVDRFARSIATEGRRWWETLVPGRRAGWGAAGLVLVVLVPALLVLSVFYLPEWFIDEPTGLNALTGNELVQAENALEQTRNAFRTTLVQAVGGALVLLTFGVGLGQLVIARQGQLVDRFTKTVQQLGDPALDVRLGAIFGLHQISARPEYARPVAEILVAYLKLNATEPVNDVKGQSDDRGEDDGAPKVRKPSSASIAGTGAAGQRVRLRPDLQAALRILVAERLWARATRTQLDLSFIQVRHADLAGVDLSDVVLIGATLDGSNLRRARLVKADLRRASLAGADLFGADLTRANLTGAKLAEADLDEAVLTDEALLVSAKFSGATLRKANLDLADASNADFTGAKLNSASLSKSVLRGAVFSGADLSGTTLQYPQLDRGTNFANANLSDIDMDEETRKLVHGQFSTGAT